MDLRAFQYVVAVAEQLNFTAAARALNVSQPALSQKIRQLEIELGLQIFARTSHQVSLTRGGELVVEHARRTLEAASRLREEVGAFRGLQRGKLRIAVIQSFSSLHMPDLLANFLACHPAIDVTVLAWANPEIIAGVDDGTLDLGIAFGPFESATWAEPIYEDRLMLACSPEHPLAGRKRVPLAALGDQTIAMLTHQFDTRRALDGFFLQHGLSPRRVELDTFAAILGLVSTNACVTILPGLSSERGDADRSLVFRPLDPQPPARVVHLVTPHSQAQSPAASAFAKIVRAAFR
jgi:LysR family transcriptional regulator, cyn operon transcriptional activator